ncbi:MAG: hypothetical protein ABI760_07850 [Ferruginibacter sp.]
MPLTSTRKTVVIYISAIIALSAINFISCQKEFSGESNGFTPVIPDFSAKVNSSLAGFVTDENDLAVIGAVVTAGTGNTITDKYGFFEIKNVQVVKEAAVVTVNRPGYFKGIKTWLATEGKSVFFRIKLIPKINGGIIDAATGGNVTILNGLSISLPPNAIVNAATNAAYTGQVNVAAHWIDPSTSDLNRTMPGDLRGLDSAGAIKFLASYGMAAIELTGSGAELLQIASGKKATITIPLPSAIAGGAPSSIPLWYFDETQGLWKEQGKAIKSGNSYIGDINHFSYWNCDVPSRYVRFNCTIIDTKRNPVQNVLVKISVAGNPQLAGYGYTDSSGYTGGAIPDNAQLLLEVFSEYNCSTALYSQNFSTTSANLALGNIIVSTSSIATITGNIVNCNNAAVSNGFVIMVKDGINYHYNADNTGSFSFSTTLCANNAGVTFIAEDIDALQDGLPATVTLLNGTNAIGVLRACGTTIDEFINYTVNGTSYSITAPADSLISFLNTQSNPPLIYIDARLKSSANGNSATMAFTQTGIAVNSSQNLMSFSSNQITDSTSILTPITVNITEFGAIGQFLAGNFTGIFTGGAPLNTPYNVTCSFRVRRMQ